MIGIVAVAFLSIFVLFTLGYGIAFYGIPRQLKEYTLWLTPWYGVVSIILILTILSLFGIPTRWGSLFVFTALGILSSIAFFQGHRIYLGKKETLIIVFITFFSLLFNLQPLFTMKFLTTISFGNNDIHAYALTADYLIDHSIAESFITPTPVGVYTLLNFGFRWGAPVLSSFFLSIFRLAGYQLMTILQAVLFALTLPLIAIFSRMIFPTSPLTHFLSIIFFSLNVNILYILYHNFFGQVLFWPLYLLFILYLFEYCRSPYFHYRTFNAFDIQLGLLFASLFFTYHEGTLLIILPLVLLIPAFRLLDHSINSTIYVLFKIVGASFFLASASMIFALIFAYFYRIDELSAPIGWQVFRTTLPYANPFEAFGFLNIHTNPSLPLLSAFFSSLVVISFFLYGLFHIKNRVLFACFFLPIFGLLLFFGPVKQHFWMYNRFITFALPIGVPVFTAGIAKFTQRKRIISFLIPTIFLFFLFISAKQLHFRYRQEFRRVEKSYVTLKDAQSYISPKDSLIITSLHETNEQDWNTITAKYFLFGINEKPFISGVKSSPIPSDNSFVLLSKESARQPSFLIRSVVWENDFFALGKLCYSNDCLLHYTEDLSQVEMGTTTGEDSLLLSGWNAKEPNSRWVGGKKALLQLVTKTAGYSQLSFETLTLNEPQKVTVVIDGKVVGTVSIGKDWKNYTLPSSTTLSSGIHTIQLDFSHTYRPSDILGNQDTRDLSANFRSIRLEKYE